MAGRGWSIGHKDSVKLGFDTLKHVTTLATGTILLLVTLGEKVFPSPRCKFVLLIGMVSLLLSAIGALGGMFVLCGWDPNAPPDDEDDSEWGIKTFVWALLLTIGGFVAGIAAVILFVALNLW